MADTKYLDSSGVQYFWGKIKGYVASFAIPLSQKATANGVASLGADGKVPAAQLPASSSLSLGETSTTAYRGDRGKTAYDHSQLKTGNPHSVTATDVGLGTAAADIAQLKTDVASLPSVAITNAEIDTIMAS